MMVPFSPSMYPDPIVLFRHTPVTSGQGAPKRTFTTPAVSLMASVQRGQPARTDSNGRTVEETPTVICTPDDPAAKADDKIVWIEPKTGVVFVFAVQSRSGPVGIGSVAWSTVCLESK